MTTTAMGEPQTSVTATHRQFQQYIGVLVCFSVLLYLLPFAVVRLPGYTHLSPNATGDAMEYIFSTPHIDADVVILGDSSAMNGLDPALMSEQLDGARVINLANMITTLPVIGTVELRKYLKQNRRPKVLVFYGTAWEADFLRQKEGQLRYSGEEMLFRHGTAGEILRDTAQHPVQVSLFPFSFYSLAAANLHWKRAGAPKANRLGHLLIGGRTLDQDCALPEPFLQQSGNVRSMQQMLSEFRDAADHVIYYAAPVPACTHTRGDLRTPFPLLGAKQPQMYPPTWFLDDTYYAHLIPGDGTAAASRDLSQAVAPLLGLEATHQAQRSSSER